MPLPHPAGAQPGLLPVSSLEAEQGPRNGGGIRGADSGTPSPPLPPGSASRQLSPGQDGGPKDEGPELCQSRAKAVSGRHSSVWFLAEFKSVGKKVVSSSPGRGSGQRGERGTEPGVDSGASGQTQRWTAPAPRRGRKGSRAPPHAAVPGLRVAGRRRRAGAGAGRAVQPAGFPRSHPRRSRGPGCGQLRSAQRRTKARLSPCRAAPQSFTYRAAHGELPRLVPNPVPPGGPAQRARSAAASGGEERDSARLRVQRAGIPQEHPGSAPRCRGLPRPSPPFSPAARGEHLRKRPRASSRDALETAQYHTDGNWDRAAAGPEGPHPSRNTRGTNTRGRGSPRPPLTAASTGRPDPQQRPRPARPGRLSPGSGCHLQAAAGSAGPSLRQGPPSGGEGGAVRGCAPGAE